MGNSLFSAAAAIAYSLRHGLQFSMPSVTPNPVWKALYLQHLVHPDYNPELPRIILAEKGFPYQPLPLDPAWAEDHVIVVDGYRQSELYFKDYREEVLAAFGFPWVDACSDYCAIHIRRGDAVRHSHKHFLQSKEWIETQMREFGWGTPFVFFSDDMQWCRDNFGDRSDCVFGTPFSKTFFELRDNRPEVADLVAMSLCSNFILSASTFAWWGAYLCRNPRKKVIVPKLWLRPGWEGTDENTWRDIYLPEWERA